MLNSLLFLQVLITKFKTRIYPQGLNYWNFGCCHEKNKRIVMLNHQNNKFSISNLLSYKQKKNKLKRIEHKRQTLYLFKLKMIDHMATKQWKRHIVQTFFVSKKSRLLQNWNQVSAIKTLDSYLICIKKNQEMEKHNHMDH